MSATNAAGIAEDSSFCEACAAMDKIIERLMAMAGEGATADEVTRLLATDGTALLRDLMQGYVDRCAERERRVEVVGAEGDRATRRAHIVASDRDARRRDRGQTAAVPGAEKLADEDATEDDFVDLDEASAPAPAPA